MIEHEKMKDRLKKALEYKNLKPTDICKKTGIPKSAMSYYLSGRSEPKANRLYVIAKTLDVSEAWLLGYDVPIDRVENQQGKDNLAELSERITKDREFRRLIVQISHLSPQQVESLKNLLAVFDHQGQES